MNCQRCGKQITGEHKVPPDVYYWLDCVCAACNRSLIASMRETSKRIVRQEKASELRDNIGAAPSYKFKLGNLAAKCCDCGKEADCLDECKHPPNYYCIKCGLK